MKQKISEYKVRLEKGIADYMQNPVSERSAVAIKAMVECWEELCSMEDKICAGYVLTLDDVKEWNAKMINDDGSRGGHWTTEQTDAVADIVGVKFEHISSYCWNVAMNMMYSDYCAVAEKYGVSVPEFYADLACAFLFDKDAKGPREKIGAYYSGIVKG